MISLHVVYRCRDNSGYQTVYTPGDCGNVALVLYAGQTGNTLANCSPQMKRDNSLYSESGSVCNSYTVAKFQQVPAGHVATNQHTPTNFVGNTAEQKLSPPDLSQIDCGMTKSPPFPSCALAWVPQYSSPTPFSSSTSSLPFLQGNGFTDLESCQKSALSTHTALDCSKYSTSTSDNVVSQCSVGNMYPTAGNNGYAPSLRNHHPSSSVFNLDSSTYQHGSCAKEQQYNCSGDDTVILGIPALPYEDEVVFSPITGDVEYSHPSSYVKTNPLDDTEVGRQTLEVLWRRKDVYQALLISVQANPNLPVFFSP